MSDVVWILKLKSPVLRRAGSGAPKWVQAVGGGGEQQEGRHSPMPAGIGGGDRSASVRNRQQYMQHQNSINHRQQQLQGIIATGGSAMLSSPVPPVGTIPGGCAFGGNNALGGGVAEDMSVRRGWSNASIVPTVGGHPKARRLSAMGSTALVAIAEVDTLNTSSAADTFTAATAAFPRHQQTHQGGCSDEVQPLSASMADLDLAMDSLGPVGAMKRTPLISYDGTSGGSRVGGSGGGSDSLNLDGLMSPVNMPSPPPPHNNNPTHNNNGGGSSGPMIGGLPSAAAAALSPRPPFAAATGTVSPRGEAMAADAAGGGSGSL